MTISNEQLAMLTAAGAWVYFSVNLLKHVFHLQDGRVLTLAAVMAVALTVIIAVPRLSFLWLPLTIFFLMIPIALGYHQSSDVGNAPLIDEDPGPQPLTEAPQPVPDMPDPPPEPAPLRPVTAAPPPGPANVHGADNVWWPGRS